MIEITPELFKCYVSLFLCKNLNYKSQSINQSTYYTNSILGVSNGFTSLSGFEQWWNFN